MPMSAIQGAAAASAQTERPGLAGPVRTYLAAAPHRLRLGSLITRRLQSERAVHEKGPCSAERV
jgi:hypothetical protein